MTLEKFILAAITTDPEKAPTGCAVFHVDSVEELHKVALNLEAILDGIAHLVSEEVFVVVRH
ncbi:capping complex subunit for YIEGIA [Bacillus fonticola]|uniref:capping complex subunit for YIEGIA n=1 Tax=Bacillus fonticola TaxID=2728853 RepID=UPI0014754F90|nr:hypothetical protein [Bacillus fonticola]